ncbi:putative transporter YrhG [Fusarium oxysporum f. sp. albedinis]|nr:putative transporter YrhG [Fusarium oxysporum f. sp. albedinis]
MGKTWDHCKHRDFPELLIVRIWQLWGQRLASSTCHCSPKTSSDMRSETVHKVHASWPMPIPNMTWYVFLTCRLLLEILG